MFSIPAVGLAKALIAVTISLHPAAAKHGPAHYTVFRTASSTITQAAAAAASATKATNSRALIRPPCRPG